MTGGCRFPEHHRGGGGSFPAALAVVVAGAVLVGTSAAFASVVHSLMYAVLGVCATVTAGLGLWLHHQRAMARAQTRRPIVTIARLEQRPGVEAPARRPAVEAPRRAAPSLTHRPAERARLPRGGGSR